MPPFRGGIVSKRAYDVVIFGATGFTGRQLTKYVAERNPEPGLRWAIAARNASKLDALATELGVEDMPRITADSQDLDSLREMTAQAHVVCTTVGPYAKYGAKLVEACVSTGTHYADLTGEPQFIRQMIDRHHEEAKNAGVRIVTCCGFDSIPSDLGVYNLQEAALEQFGAPLEQVEMVVLSMRGAFSGGTIASVINMMNSASDKQVRRALGDPYSLTPGERGLDGSPQASSRYSESAQAWTAPFFMAAINEKVVRRSNVLLDYRWGKSFRYGESMRTGSGLRGRVTALGASAASAAVVLGLAVPPIRQFADRYLLPSPGEGPSEEAIEKGFFKIGVFGRGRDDQRLSLTVRGKRDPGYGATACMLAESGICLAQNVDLPAAGVLTPASAMGAQLTQRLNATDVTFELDEA